MLNILNAVTAGNTLFLAFMILTVRRDYNRAANRWLALFLGMFGIFLFDDTLVCYGIYDIYPRLLGFTFLPVLAFAPVIFLCVSAFVSVGSSFRKRDLWHFLPFGLFFLLDVPYLILPGSEKLRALAEEKAAGPQMEDKILVGIIVLQIVAYLFFSLRKLLKHRKYLENLTASPDDFRLNWLLWSLLGFDVLMLFWLFEILQPNFRQDGGGQTIVYFLSVYALAFFALRQKEVFPFSEKNTAEVRELLNEIEESAVSKRNLLSEARLLEMKSSLLKNMETQKPYLDPELNLPTLAGKLDLSLNELSELVNQGFGENFNQFVNRYRVEESKRLLVSDKHAHLSMVGIAFEAGFNSKTAFNTTFKKMTGFAPTDFKNSVGGSFN
jgi:AraC-like DNA-binding protein